MNEKKYLLKNKLIKTALFVFAISIASLSAFAQKNDVDRERNTPVEPFRIIGNVYYVGASEVTAFLITTPQGHILLDGGFAATASQIKENIEKLGFKMSDVKYLLNSQAHYDHAGGLAELKRLTGARMVASAGDKPQLENGGKNDFHLGDRGDFEPVAVDRIIRDGEQLSLGGVNVKALLTPGHTKGCTSWTLEAAENDRKYTIVFVGSTTSLDYKLRKNEKYPSIARDFEKTFRVLKKVKADVFLASHGSFFDLAEKAARLKKGESPNPFIDPQGYREFIAATEKDFREKLAKQSAD
ncbi:MAG TPA: subclass B3 metallo-beta-lactamase [Pyrinomonadaceae bacterium]|jgi:metallo-beta-lactamase class B